MTETGGKIAVVGAAAKLPDGIEAAGKALGMSVPEMKEACKYGRFIIPEKHKRRVAFRKGVQEAFDAEEAFGGMRSGLDSEAWEANLKANNLSVEAAREHFDAYREYICNLIADLVFDSETQNTVWRELQVKAGKLPEASETAKVSSKIATLE